MRYVSTRGSAPELEFEEALLAGLARDGGLYVPSEWPRFSADDLRALRGLPYDELAFRVIRPFVGDAFTEDELRRILSETYGRFTHRAVAPIKQLEPNLFLLELFHGPTLAFKDYAMQVLARLFDAVLARRGERVTILGATSGDTGAAAVDAFKGAEVVDLFMLFPEGRVSPVQQRQMTTIEAGNIHALAVRGTFDDCQDLVKDLFNDHGFRDAYKLSAVNSINWARILPQIVYYVAAAVAVGAPDRAVAFSVPTGNFGNIFAAYAARQMGLPVERLVCASNENDILTRFFRSGAMTIEGVRPTLSPSMDIQVSSNFERYLFDLLDRDGAAVTRVMTDFRASGRFEASQGMMDRAAALFTAASVDNAATTKTIAGIHEGTGETVDPHTAVGLAAAASARESRAVDPAVPLISLACAHPVKFRAAVEGAIGSAPDLPHHMADLMERPEHHQTVDADAEGLKRFIASNVTGRGVAA